ncbi:MAG: SgcJ/EcaC family oxidoreductase [Deltaproteobacteria bacterium]|nr:SgcJ/EcaC family oxidoreductase [Deltaproteobacteria bacterium]
MPKHPVETLIAQADAAINQEDFATLMEIYAEDAVLVVQPGRNAVGKAQIQKAFEAIAQHFGHSLEVKEAGMEVLATDDTALVLAKTLVSAQDHPTVERKATYVFKKDAAGDWRCVIDNSYGFDLLDSGQGEG